MKIGKKKIEEAARWNNLWRQQWPFGPAPDLPGADLSWANLSRADLSRANLSWANLSRADLSRADLSRADLSRANLSRAQLSEADLERAQLSRAQLSEADLERADLSWAWLNRCTLSETRFSQPMFSAQGPGSGRIVIFFPEMSVIFAGCETYRAETPAGALRLFREGHKKYGVQAGQPDAYDKVASALALMAGVEL